MVEYVAPPFTDSSENANCSPSCENTGAFGNSCHDTSESAGAPGRCSMSRRGSSSREISAVPSASQSVSSKPPGPVYTSRTTPVSETARTARCDTSLPAEKSTSVPVFDHTVLCTDGNSGVSIRTAGPVMAGAGDFAPDGFAPDGFDVEPVGVGVNSSTPTRPRSSPSTACSMNDTRWPSGDTRGSLRYPSDE